MKANKKSASECASEHRARMKRKNKAPKMSASTRRAISKGLKKHHRSAAGKASRKQAALTRKANAHNYAKLK